jgi:RHS repeat-associated protein
MARNDPTGSISSQTNRGFTGHEELDAVGLVHMNGRVYDPLLARFGVPDPTTESPFSTQGWNRYSYVGNSPVNFTDPSGYCFLGCFWKPIFAAIGNFLRQNWGAILQIAAAAICQPLGIGPVCAGVAAAFVTGITSGNLGLALRAGFIAAVTASAMFEVGEYTSHGDLQFLSDTHLLNMAGHALVGCLSAVANRGRCGSGALSGAVGSFAGPLLTGLSFESKLVSTSVLGGLASVAGGGKFANGAITAAFGYLFNGAAHDEKVREIARYLEANGYDVLLEPNMKDANGRVFRGDIMYSRNDDIDCGCPPETKEQVDKVFGRFGVVDVKTEEGPNFTPNQTTGYSDFNRGLATSYTSGTEVFGYSNGDQLPAGTVVIYTPPSMGGIYYYPPNSTSAFPPTYRRQ